MTDDTNNDQASTPAPSVDPTPPPAPESNDQGKLYAAYDHTLLRFVSGTGTKAEATNAAKAGPKGHRLTVRQV